MSQKNGADTCFNDQRPLPSNHEDACFKALIDGASHSHIRRFLQGLIHNINGPLQNMSMLTEILERGISKVLEETEAEELSGESVGSLHSSQNRLHQMRDQINSLGEMLRDFVTFYDVQRNGVEINIPALLDLLKRIFRADLFFKHKIQTELIIGKDIPFTRVPGSVLAPVFTQIITNCVIAMRAAQRRELTIECVSQPGQVVVTFKDTGCGFEAGAIDESGICLLDSRWPQEIRDLESGIPHFGIGLAMVKEYLSPYGATVDFRQDGDHTITTLTLPSRR